ncbi:energy-coupling factor transporter ATP-binding protein EcfA2 [Paraburkholderia youngii]|uniref:ATP-binding protein n=1 Tax=Paraburkholderia youngii TaxID=2782701 RepID=UPI003D1B4198
MITREQAIAGSPSDKENYMNSIRIPHRNQTSVLSDVDNRMKPGAGLSITIVVGPTGVGKTTLGKMELNKLLSAYAIKIQEDANIIPAFMSEVDAPAPNSKEINWALQYTRLCHDLVAPGPLDGINLAASMKMEMPLDYVKCGQLMFEHALRARETHHLILDEAVHLSCTKTDPQEYGNLLKSLSNRARFHLLLLGAYGSEKIQIASGELARRVKVVHYQRYKETEADFKEYCIFVKSFVEHFPLNCEVDIKDRLEYLFLGTFGLPGLTIDVLKEAVKACVVHGGSEWRDKYLLASMPSIEAQRKIAKDTINGERNVLPFLQQDKEHAYLTEQQVRSMLLLEAEQAKKLDEGTRP